MMEDTGASSVEYGLLTAGIAAVIVAVVFLLGGATLGLFDDTCQAVHAQLPSTSSC